MFDVNDLNSVQVGDLLVLRDFHTLSATGTEATFGITDVNVWGNSELNMFGLEVEVDEEEGINLMLVVRQIGGNYDYRLFRRWDFDTKENFDGLEVIAENPDTEEEDFCNFSIVHTGEEEDGELQYMVKSPYPFWDMDKNDGQQVAIAEYLATEEGLEDNYWAKHALVEWYAYVNDDGQDGLVTVWFGWDVGCDDIDIIQQ